jgi:hypothetical protein
MHRAKHGRLLVIALVAACPALTLSACTDQEAAESAHYEPARLSAIPDSDVQRVTLTAEGIERLGLQTATVRATAKGAVLPYGALLYNADGDAFAYTNPAPRSFVRRAIEVARIDDDRVLLDTGPAPGTKVVTTGAAEVLGAEFEVGH